MPPLANCSRHQSLCTGVWLLWLLVLQPAQVLAAQAQDQQQQQHVSRSSNTPIQPPQQPARKLLADTKLYCNVTSECKPCLAKHLVSEACRPTAYTEHLTCSTNEAITHETVITIHRRLSPRTTLLHVSRSCRAPAEEDSKASSSSDSDGDDGDGKGSGDSGTRAKPLPALSEQVMQFGSSSSSSDSSDSSSEGDISLSGAAAAGHLYPLSAVGGLNLLYFELAMVVILSGALPIVYVRKRRFAR